jgi:hypothetical protein
MRLNINKTKKKIKNTRALIGFKSMGENSLKTYLDGEIVFFYITPHNLAVLSPENILYRINALANVLKNVQDLEIACQNSQESFEDNKAYLEELATSESVASVRKLDEGDRQFLDDIQLSMATSRRFSISLRFINKKESEIRAATSRCEKFLKEQGFDVKLAKKADIKKMLAIYFEQNTTQSDFADFDGEAYIENIDRGDDNV